MKLKTKWNLISDPFVSNEEKIRIYSIDKRLTRIFNQPIFKDGIYNIERFDRLQKLL